MHAIAETADGFSPHRPGTVDRWHPHCYLDLLAPWIVGQHLVICPDHHEQIFEQTYYVVLLSALYVLMLASHKRSCSVERGMMLPPPVGWYVT